MTIIDTERLRLRPWNRSDAPALYELAKEPRIGMACGWRPHTSIDDAYDGLSTVLAAPESYAVTLRESNELVGAIALRMKAADSRDVADLGYWTGRPYWGNGYATEAGRAIVDRATHLGYATLTLSYFEGNEASRRVAHKLGFTWQGREEGVEFPLIGKRVSLHRTAMALTQG